MKRIIKSILLAMIIQFSFSYIPVLKYNIPDYVTNLFMEFISVLEQSMHSFGLENFIICISLAYIVYHRYEKIKFNVNSVVALIFTIICLISKAVMYTGTITCLYNSFYNMFFTVISFIGYYVILKILVDFIYEKLFINKNIDLSKMKKVYDFIFEKHPFIMPVLIILVFYLPYIIITYPGTVCYDGYFQIRQFFTDAAFDHHPFLSTIFFYCLYSVGDIFLSSKDAIFGIIIFQVILQLITYGLIFKIFKEEKVSNVFRIFALIFILLFVVTKIGSVTVQKDTLFQTGIILFTISIYYYLKGNNNIKSLFPVLLSALFLYMFKHSSYQIIIITMTILLFKDKCFRRILFNIFVITLFIGINSYYHNVFMPENHIIPSFKSEELFGQIQCIGRYLKYYPEDITKEEREVLDKVLLDFNVVYNPEDADFAKSSIDENCSKKDILEFKRIWLKLGLRHPIIYIDSFFNTYYGYMYPTKEPRYWEEAHLDGLGTYISYSYYEPYSRLVFPNESLMLESIGFTKMRMPFISIFYNCAFCSWILILLIGYIIKNRVFKELLLLTPTILCFISLFLGPINAFIRYVYPIYIPLLFCLGIIVYKTNKK